MTDTLFKIGDWVVIKGSDFTSRIRAATVLVGVKLVDGSTKDRYVIYELMENPSEDRMAPFYGEISYREEDLELNPLNDSPLMKALRDEA